MGQENVIYSLMVPFLVLVILIVYSYIKLSKSIVSMTNDLLAQRKKDLEEIKSDFAAIKDEAASTKIAVLNKISEAMSEVSKSLDLIRANQSKNCDVLQSGQSKMFELMATHTDLLRKDVANLYDRLEAFSKEFKDATGNSYGQIVKSLDVVNQSLENTRQIIVRELSGGIAQQFAESNKQVEASREQIIKVLREPIDAD